jgi:hypothetical protein
MHFKQVHILQFKGFCGCAPSGDVQRLHSTCKGQQQQQQQQQQQRA